MTNSTYVTLRHKLYIKDNFSREGSSKAQGSSSGAFSGMYHYQLPTSLTNKIKLQYTAFIPCIEEMVHCNTNMIHPPIQSPGQKRVWKGVDDQIILKGKIYLGGVRKSTLFPDSAEDAHCSRKLIHQSGVCPFIPEQNTQFTENTTQGAKIQL